MRISLLFGLFLLFLQMDSGALVMEQEYQVEVVIDGEKTDELTVKGKPEQENLIEKIDLELDDQDEVKLTELKADNSDQDIYWRLEINEWRTETEEQVEILPYGEETRENDQLLKGKTRKIQEGQRGSRIKEIRSEYLGDELINEEKNYDVIELPQTEIIEKGTYEPPGYSYIEDKEVIEVKGTETGEASWYGARFHGNRTFSGEIYDMYDLTAAHPSLPMNSLVHVEFPVTGESVIVRINDRGPHVGGRIIDLSKQAAEKIGLAPHGVGDVKVKVLENDN